MNWRRGFLRLWLVASVIWVAGNAFVFQLPRNLIEVTPWLRPTDPASAGAPAGWWADIPPAPLPPLPPGYVLREDPPTQSEGPWVKYQAEAREARRQGAIASLWSFVFFGIGPPVAALFLGIAAMWVLRGFRLP